MTRNCDVRRVKAAANADKEKALKDSPIPAALLEKLDALLKDKIREQAEQTKGFGIKTISLEGQKEEIELVERVWKTVGAEVEALKVEIDAPARVTSSPDESAYATKHENTPLKVTLGAGFGGFGLVLFGIIFLEFRARRLANADEVS